MAELLSTISNLSRHTHFIKRRHTLKICESKVFFVKFLSMNGDSPGGVIDLIWNLT
jgi:hypothetical protein